MVFPFRALYSVYTGCAVSFHFHVKNILKLYLTLLLIIFINIETVRYEELIILEEIRNFV